MNKMRKYVYALAALLALSFVSCEDDPELKESMAGFIYINAPQFVMLGDEIEMETGGVGAVSKITYSWTGDLIKNSSLKIDTIVDATKLKLTVGGTPGPQSLIVYAEADGYYKRQLSTSINVLSRDTDKALIGPDFEGCEKMTDARDGKSYYYTKAGDLYWFSQNLSWEEKGTSYGHLDALQEVFGSLYTWNEATGGVSASGLGGGPQGVCPEGWSVPTREDWENLAGALSGEQMDFDGVWPGLGEKVTVEALLNDIKVWPFSLQHHSRNMFKWNALACGYGNVMSDYFNALMERGMWWSSTQQSDKIGLYRYIYYDESSFPYAGTDKSDMMVSVRCVKKIK